MIFKFLNLRMKLQWNNVVDSRRMDHRWFVRFCPFEVPRPEMIMDGAVKVQGFCAQQIQGVGKGINDACLIKVENSTLSEILTKVPCPFWFNKRDLFCRSL